MLSNDVMVGTCFGEYNKDTKKKGIKTMIIRERVYESKLAVKILRNPDLAEEFGLEISTNKVDSDKENLENKIPNKTKIPSTEA